MFGIVTGCPKANSFGRFDALELVLSLDIASQSLDA